MVRLMFGVSVVLAGMGGNWIVESEENLVQSWGGVGKNCELLQDTQHAFFVFRPKLGLAAKEHSSAILIGFDCYLLTVTKFADW
jgi:hypothetical protein